jgi:hypothetical protein
MLVAPFSQTNDFSYGFYAFKPKPQGSRMRSLSNVVIS